MSEFENLFRLSHKWKNGARGVKIKPSPNMIIWIPPDAKFLGEFRSDVRI
jgi:hypothetical protein